MDRAGFDETKPEEIWNSKGNCSASFLSNTFPFHIPVEVALSYCTAQSLETQMNWGAVGGHQSILESQPLNYEFSSNW